MSALREASDHIRQLLSAIGREHARAAKRRAVYREAGRYEIAKHLTRRMQMLARLRDEALLRLDPTARIVDIGQADEPLDALVLSPKGVVLRSGTSAREAEGPLRGDARVEFPAMTADPIDEDDLLEGLV